jgi:nucleoside-diphosphate-sugar epimerase
MRVFVTGATGFIGSAIVRELIADGHEVLGLARSDAAGKSLAAAGAKVHLGTLDDLHSLRSGAEASDAVIHTAFIHDFSKYKANCETDRRAIEALGSALAGSDRPLIVTSGTALLAAGRVGVEENASAAPSVSSPRAASEEAARSAAARGVRVSVVRLPPSVHGDGDHGFVPALIKFARQKRAAAYVGDGANRWPAVHRLDAAHLYRLALEKAPAGSAFHAIADEGIPTRQIAEVIGRHLELPVVSIAPEDAAEHFGWMGMFFGVDAPASSALTQERLGWRPTHPGLIEDLEQGHYFKQDQAAAA